MLAATAHRKYHFHTLVCAIRSTSASCHGGNVRFSLKDNYRMSETLFFPGWEAEISAKCRKCTDSLSGKHWRLFVTFRGATIRAATQLWHNAECDNLYPFGFFLSLLGSTALLPTLVCFGRLLLPSVTYFKSTALKRSIWLKFAKLNICML